MLTNRQQNGRGLGLEVIEITNPELFAGISRKATTENHFKVAQQLANDFVDLQSHLRYRATPQVTVTMTGTKDSSGEFDYFIGENVQKPNQEKTVNLVTLEPGTYAQLRVKKNPSFLLGWRLARVRKIFYSKFLPNSDYEKSERFDEIEYYGYESQLHPRRAQTMTLLIPIKKKS
ncbi:MAG TPA: GyrI-like domain-containing protein [Anaerolineaceae bacterium]|nr:GyrI-like domain-containing protein [Anaerolineaceae bacterium]